MRKLSLLAICILLQGCWTTERGEKVGTIVKSTRNGVIFRTQEAELIRGSMTDGSGAFGKPFDFTIENDKLLEAVNFAMSHNKEVKIMYHRELFTWFFRCESENYFLDDIQIN